MKALTPLNEVERLRALQSYAILDTEQESEFDDLVAIASSVCETPIALISLVDEDRQWFKARVGLDVRQTSRDMAFCAHAILEDGTTVVPDATRDDRFRDNPLVKEAPSIRFYAGAPLRTSEGHALGTLCVIDTAPRETNPITADQLDVIEALSRQAVRLLDLGRVNSELATALSRVKLLSPLVPVCAWCKSVRDDNEFWMTVQAYLKEGAGVDVTHGICPTCALDVTRGLKPKPDGD